MSTEEDIEFQTIFIEDLVPKIEGSSIAVSLCPTNELDGKFCTELGAMIMLNKPILAVLEPGAEVPGKLALVADRIIHADLATDEGRQTITREIRAFVDDMEAKA